MLLQIALIVAAGYGAFVAAAYFAQEKLVYFPAVGREQVATPAQMGLPHEELTLRTKDGVRLHAWYVSVPQPRGVVLFLHGNAGNISHRLDSLAMFARLGYATLIVDYRGYGRSEGRPSEEGTYLDALAAWRHLTAERGIAPGDVVLFGESLGAAVAAWLAAQVQPRALVILSGFVSVPELGQEVYPLSPRQMARPVPLCHGRLPEGCLLPGPGGPQPGRRGRAVPPRRAAVRRGARAEKFS